ncbi:hypothetical protein MYCTH_2086765 [Thermothelomyces thermophilus ATCC 42464]|uniref:Histone deacetylase complex subunit SAP30 Sin3 binding domain-containing protein n=1 Tax=Thermothelomyces thermophilus (strain ATCC 42464 / BCRC 31852 / DSM 1799) TaxID=573729 RepID=G2Q5N4_THET4|nr:uncharacterized protein MYCTH_2086765 [Thermothelomyces thermophilus ATCC 42464]AEO55470.1 hypothetical protein MYCTH_2086765 [Thermothelomyces thermophilus ATCC 42464]
MPPSKAARGGQDDSKTDTQSTKDKNGSGGGTKMRRVASNAGSNLREVTNANATTTAAAAPDSTANTQEASTPGLQWPAFDRDVLHAYRRAYRLRTPTAFVSDHHEWVLTQPGSIGLYSPTIARRKELRRQTKDQLTNVVRKHFNGMGIQENDIIVDFLHKVRSQGVKKGRPPRREYIHLEGER